jgi:hypothetical protein
MKLDYDEIVRERAQRRIELERIIENYYKTGSGLSGEDEFLVLCVDEMRNSPKRSSGMKRFVHAWSAAEIAEQLRQEFNPSLDKNIIAKAAYSHDLLEDAWRYDEQELLQRKMPGTGHDRWKPYEKILDVIVLLSTSFDSNIAQGRKCKAYQVLTYGEKKAELAYALIGDVLDNVTDIEHMQDRRDKVLSRYVASLIVYVNTLKEYIPELVEPITQFARNVEEQQKLTKVKEYLVRFEEFSGQALEEMSRKHMQTYLSD